MNGKTSALKSLAGRMKKVLFLLLFLAVAGLIIKFAPFQRASAGVSPEQATAMATLQFRLTQLVVETQPVYATMDASRLTATLDPALTVGITPIPSQAAATETAAPELTLAVSTATEAANSQSTRVPTEAAAVGGETVTEAAPVSKELPGATALSMCYKATILDEVISPDAVNMAAGANFVKTWRIRNDGTCTWQSGTQLVYLGGERMSQMEAYHLATQVLPGGVMDISAGFTAPTRSGTFIGNWQLLSVDGQVFGTGEQAQNSFEIKINVP